MSFDEDDNVETTLAVIKECYVYKIPPRATSHGYRAADWNLDTPMWTGRCTVSSEGDLCRVKLEDANTGELFATCPVTEAAIEPVTDSSRYYVMKIEDGSGRHAFIGMGFAERSIAFDFSAALQDHQKYVKSKKESEELAKKMASQPKKDYSLPEGAKIHVDLKNKKAPSPSTSATGFSSGGGLLPPPPSSSRAKSTPTKAGNQAFFGNQDLFGQPQQQQQQQNQDFFGGGQQQNQDFFGNQPQFQGFQQNQFQQNQFAQQNQFSQQNQFQQNQFQGSNAPSNDFWGDFTGSSAQQQPQSNAAPKQNNQDWFF
eukprot:TRINITY_DN3122_c0_g1_i1.p1 TRINITY_DN3122_c0_g1~~TRINITY_DN3122_c0_g1_i1.p1  ORF type:complete len:313 (+),score=64.05 TRINITY_DN3122_c0_g1_i1:86-1024(+)